MTTRIWCDNINIGYLNPTYKCFLYVIWPIRLFAMYSSSKLIRVVLEYSAQCFFLFRSLRANRLDSDRNYVCQVFDCLSIVCIER